MPKPAIVTKDPTQVNAYNGRKNAVQPTVEETGVRSSVETDHHLWSRSTANKRHIY